MGEMKGCRGDGLQMEWDETAGKCEGKARRVKRKGKRERGSYG